MPTTIKIEATNTPAEVVKTYFIKLYDGNTVFIQTTDVKINALLNILGDLGVDIEDWGELKDYGGIYSL